MARTTVQPVQLHNQIGIDIRIAGAEQWGTDKRHWGVVMNRRSWLILGLPVLAIGTTSWAGSSLATKQDAEESAFSKALPDVVDELIAETMASDYGLAIDEARRRTAEVPGFQELTEAVLRTVGEDGWGGSWIDHIGSGQLVLNVRSDEFVDIEALSRGLVAPERVRVNLVKYSIADLEVVADKVVDLLGDSGFSDLITDNVTNTIQVQLPDPSAELAATKIDALAGLPVTFRFGVQRAEPAACFSNLMSCNLPARGGMEIWDAGGGGHCTAGFITRSLSDNVRFLLTAGHCMDLMQAGGWWWIGSTMVDGTNYDLGVPHQRPGWTNPWLYDASHDVAMIRLDLFYPGTISSTRVLVQASGGTSPTTYNESYPISSVGLHTTLATNDYLCMSGTMSKTQCSKYNGTSAVNNNYVQMTVADGGETLCRGDSGGPVYKLGKAYGIVHAFVSPTSAVSKLTRFQGTVFPQCVGAGGLWYYYTMQSALSQTNTTIMP